ncbi:hypothetical protein, partial [Fructobacillus tropaeoli]
MIYNKQRISKVKEKKVLRKVKSQWIVVSLVTFGMIAGAGLVQTASANDISSQKVVATALSNTNHGDNSSTSPSSTDSSNSSTSLSNTDSSNSSTSLSSTDSSNSSTSLS